MEPQMVKLVNIIPFKCCMLFLSFYFYCIFQKLKMLELYKTYTPFVP